MGLEEASMPVVLVFLLVNDLLMAQTLERGLVLSSTWS